MWFVIYVIVVLKLICGDCDKYRFVEEEEEEGILEEEIWGDGCMLWIDYLYRLEESMRFWFRWLRNIGL